MDLVISRMRVESVGVCGVLCRFGRRGRDGKRVIHSSIRRRGLTGLLSFYFHGVYTYILLLPFFFVPEGAGEVLYIVRSFNN